MRYSIRRLATVAILAAALSGLFFSPAWAYSITGGTDAQRADVRATLEAAQFPPISWVEARVGSVEVSIQDSNPPYWELVPDGEVFYDTLHAIAGVAWWGHIIVRPYDPGPSTFFREVVAHEWSHQVWFAMPLAKNQEWIALVTDGLSYDPANWRHNPAESHAEQLRVAAWTSDYWTSPNPRTDLHVLGSDFVRDWHLALVTPTTTTTLAPPTTSTTLPPPPPPPTTTTTAPRGDPFPDVTREDTELWAAAWWGRDHGVLLGFPDGTLGPYGTLTRRHAALMIGRAGGGIRIPWVFDYGVPTRGELAAAYPGYAWDSDRWEESLLRSQLLRLLWRAAR